MTGGIQESGSVPAKRKAREKDASEDEDEGGSGEATPMAGMLVFFCYMLLDC